LPHENLLYLADRLHFPYGNKSHKELQIIITNTIEYISRYHPKLIVIASNTPSVQLLDDIKDSINIPVVGVRPPLKEACHITKKKHIGIMATEATIRSKKLEDQIQREVPQNFLITKFNASPVIELIENGTFLTDQHRTYNVISHILGDDIESKIDVITLSSTHLPFVTNYLTHLLPTMKFLDPAKMVAKDARKCLASKKALKKQGSGEMQVLATEGKKDFERIIRSMGFTEHVEEVPIHFRL
jgi:glutamate racemase